MALIKILHIANGVAPFIQNKGIAEFVEKLACLVSTQQQLELRIMAPCAPFINQRKHGLHHVLRLSDLNISMGGEQYAMLVKVAALKSAKVHVYFIDNEEIYERTPAGMKNKPGCCVQNDLQAIFFAKGSLFTAKKQGWAPDIIHAIGWGAALVPLYLQTTFKNSPLFKNTKAIYTPHQDRFEQQFDFEQFLKRSKLREVQPEHFDLMGGKANYNTISALGAHYADATLHSYTPEDDADKELLKAINSRYVDSDLAMGEEESYLKIYQSLLGKR